MKVNFHRMEQIMRDLVTAAQSDTISISDLALAMMMNALPASYAPIRAVLESNENLTWKDAKTRIQAEEQSQINHDMGENGFAGVATW